MKNDNDGTGNLFDYEGGKKRTRADQIWDHFAKYHRNNLRVWQLFDHYAHVAIDAGFRHYSSSAIIERIRWHISMETQNEDGLKICNDFRAYYARMFHVAYPEHKGFFRNRKRRSLERPEVKGDPPPTIDPADPGDNLLDWKLRGLLDEKT